MNATKIEWVKNPDGTQGYTWNPITGCLNHVNGMCKGGGFPCYAYRLANGRLRHLYLTNNAISNALPDKHTLSSLDPFYPRFWPERLLEPHSGRDKGIFACDMSDLFGIGIPPDWTEQVMAVINACRQHRFYLLTKQPQNLVKWSPFPENCWVGVTATNTVAYSIAVKYLQVISAKVKYLSIEPMLSRIITNYWELDRRVINLVIIGGQTKPTVMPKIEWVDEITEATTKAGIPVFWKDNLHPLIDDYYRGNFRQEMPLVITV